ncbi:uncharacterized protein PV09_03006 [Verruconis gallopava]|uniref:RING-type E3 ubiquitin transferase n=1 Tax=Verruconis gallopava TaxID=253628 RepID=A0A0D1YYM1_9PEZI|nr:uncharacterized protein PV09_03006 [Verruconis gallopava]KIW05797.1 hypothetical protein PV09_03006 [Verruconis gallopava]
MDEPELGDARLFQQPDAPEPARANVRHSRLSSFVSLPSGRNSTNPIDGNGDIGAPMTGNRQSFSNSNSRASRLHMQIPSFLRRLRLRRPIIARSRDHDSFAAVATPDQVAPATSSRRTLPFAVHSTASTNRVSYVQEAATTLSDRRNRYEEAERGGNVVSMTHQREDNDGDQEREQQQGQGQETRQGQGQGQNVDNQPGANIRSSRRRRLSLQMSNFFSDITSSASRHASPPFLPPRSRLSVHEPLPELDNALFQPPTPAEIRMTTRRDDTDDGEESEYERGFTPRRRRLRPLPVVGEPHDEDYVRRRYEDDRLARRATWAPINHSSIGESSLGSFESVSRPTVELSASSSSSISHGTELTPPSRSPAIYSQARPDPSNTDLLEPINLPTAYPPTAPQPRQSQSPATSPNMLRPAHLLRQMLARRRNISPPDPSQNSLISLIELQRLLAAYALQSGDHDYNGHQETTFDGGTITIYGIRRVNTRAAPDSEQNSVFPTPTRSDTSSEERSPPSRDRPRGPRRIFNFIGPALSEIDPLPPEFEETFQRLRRTRRPRSMFGSGSLRRNGMVEPDVPDATESSSEASDENSQASDNDETWIFYIVSAVLPEGHPLLSAPSLFTENPTYEDMLFLDSFLQKPVASKTDLANARGLYRIRRRSDGRLYASSEETAGDIIEITTERCQICLDDYDEDDETRHLVKCSHYFHRECIDHWLTECRNSCPLCRGEGVEKTGSARNLSVEGPSAVEASPLNV